MIIKSNQINRSLIVNAVLAVVMLLIARLVHFNYADALNSVAGLAIAGICTVYFQRIITFDWLYPLRFALQAVAIGYVFLMIILSYLITGTDTFDLQKVLLSTALGCCFGAIWGLGDYLLFTRLVRKIPYSGLAQPVLVSKSNLWISHQFHNNGIAILLSDRILFLGKNSKNHEILLIDIQSLEVQSSMYAPIKLMIGLKEEDVVSISLSMPYIWQKKITEA